MSGELSCGEVAGVPKLVPFSFSFFLFRFHGKEKIFRWNFGHENENEKEICFRFRNLAKKLAQDAKFCVTETKKKFVSVSGIWQKNWRLSATASMPQDSTGSCTVHVCGLFAVLVGQQVL